MVSFTAVDYLGRQTKEVFNKQRGSIETPWLYLKFDDGNKKPANFSFIKAMVLSNSTFIFIAFKTRSKTLENFSIAQS